MMKGLASCVLVVLLLVCSLCGLTWAASITGTVQSVDTGDPIARATVRVLNTGRSTLTNDDGRYELRLGPGEYQLKFTHIGYYSETRSVSVDADTIILDIQLRAALVDIGTITVYDRQYDPAQRIIVEAIRRKTDILERIHDYTFEAYTRFVLRDETKDTAEIMMIAESQVRGFWEQPDNYKQIIVARKQSANIDAENNLVSVGEMLNFNKNRIEIGDYNIVTPTAKDALDHYNYYLLDTVAIDGRPVFRLEVEPKDPNAPLFAGTVDIVDSTYDVVGVDVGFSDGVRLPFVIGPRYAQTMAQFEDEYWMPVEIRFASDVEFEFPIPGFPNRLSFAHVASIHSFEFEQGIPAGTFDEFVLEVDRKADDVDSVEWDQQQTVALTDEERQAYQRIDSVESQPPSVTRILGMGVAGGLLLAGGGAPEFFHFNRVEGPYLGVGVHPNGLADGRVDLDAALGYSFDAEEWNHRYRITYDMTRKDRYALFGEYRNRFTRRPTIVSEDFEPTPYALLYQIDPYDYYLEKGYSLGFSARLLKYTRISIAFHDYEHESATVNSDFALFDENKIPRVNPPVIEGDVRAVEAIFRYDSRPMVRDKGEIRRWSAPQYTLFSAGIEYSDPDFVDSDFKYTRAWASIVRRQRFGALGISSVRVYGGIGSSRLPPQRYFTVDFGTEGLYNWRGYQTLDETNFHGNVAAALAGEHDFDNRLFRRSGVPGLRLLPFTFSVHGGVFWTNFEDHVGMPGDQFVRTAQDLYSEIGFGLGNLTPFLSPFNLAAYFTWQLTAYNTSRFQFSIGIKL